MSVVDDLLARLRKAELERDTMRETLTICQARCTELLEENRRLRGEGQTIAGASLRPQNEPGCP